MELLSPIVNVNDLINKGYVDKKFLAGLKVSGNRLAYTLNGTDYLLTVPYATYTSTVAVTNTEPTGGTTYYPAFVAGLSNNTTWGIRANDTIAYRLFEGTADTAGVAGLWLGNATASGTAGNAYGYLRLYGTNTGYTELRAKSQTGKYAGLYLPSANGTLVYHTTGTAIGSANAPVYVDSTGKVTACTYPCLGMSKIAASTDVGTLTESLLYWTDSDGNSSNLTNSAFTSSHAMLQVVNHISGTDYRRARIAFDCTGVLKTFNDRGTPGEGGIWYTVLTTNNFTTHLNGTYVRKAGDTMTGRLTLPYLTISDTAASAHIQFSRASYNYICAPTNGIIAIMPNGGGQSSATGYYFDGTKLYAGTTNSKALGSSTYRWSNVYSVKGDFASSDSGIVTVRRTSTGGAWIDYYHANQDTNYWRVGSNASGLFSFGYNGTETGLKVNTSGQLVSEKATGTAPFVVASTTEVANLHSATATKLHTARTIALSGAVTGTATSFDGSANITISTRPLNIGAVVRNTNNYPYHRILSFVSTTTTYSDFSAIYRITQAYNGGGTGVFRVTIRKNMTRAGTVIVEWLERTYLLGNVISYGFNSTYNNTILDVFYKSPGTYASCNIELVSSSTGRNSNGFPFTLVASSEVDNTTTEDKLTSYEVYSSVESGMITDYNSDGSVLRVREYTTIANATFASNFSGTLVPAVDNDRAFTLGNTSYRWSAIYSNTLNLSGSLTASGDIHLENTKRIYIKDTSGNYNSALDFGRDNTFRFGLGASTNGYNTCLLGNRVYLQYGSTPVTGLLLNESGNVGIGITSPTHKLHVNGGLKVTDNILTTPNKFICTSETSTWTHKYTDADGNEQTISLPHYGYVIDTNPANYIGGGFLSSYFGLNFHVGSAPIKIRFGYGGATGVEEMWTTTLTGGGALTLAQSASIGTTLTVNGTSTLKGAVTTGGSLTTGSHILPSTHGGASIGQTAQRWAAGYFTTAVNIGAANSSAQGGTANTTIGAGRIELSYSAPYIDFHYNNSTSDYTNRIIEGLSGQLTVTGKLRVGLASGTSTNYNFHVVGTAYASTSVSTPTGNITTVNATTLRRIQSAASTVPTIWVSSGNYDNTVLRVDYSKNTNYYGDYGFTLKYMGTGGGYQNNLNLYADNTTVATQNIAWSVNQLGQVAIRTAATNTSYDLYVNSTAYIPTLTVTEMKIGDATITWDSTNNALKIDKSVYSTGGVSALGYSETTSDGNGSGIVSTVLSEYNLINTTLTEDVTVVASAYATKRIYNSVKTNTTNISTLQTNYSALSTTVNNHTAMIDMLNNSEFYSSGDASEGIRLTWFTSSGGGRSVIIPTWNSLGQIWNTYDGTPCLISGLLFDDIADMINTYAVTGIGTSGNYLTYTKNGTTTNVTVPYASYSGYSNSVKSTVPTSTAAAYATGYLKSYYAGGSNTVTNKPTGVDAFGMISMQTASGYTGQILISANTNVDMYWKTGASGSLASVSWKKLLDDSNTSFTQTLTSGTAIGTIKIGGTSTTIYAPTPTSTVTVVNNLTSTSTTSALSANQGRVLKNSITDIESALSTLGTSSQLDYTSSITSGSTNLVTSGGVYSYVTSNYLPLSGGTITGSLSIEGSSNGISLYDSSGNENVLILGSGGISCSTVNGYTLAAACAKGVSDSSSASALSSSDTNLATVRDIYYGTPKINNSKGYTSSTTIYAPTAGGTAGYYLKGAGTTTAPTWQAYSTTPTSGSTTLITSGAVYTALANQKVSVSQTLTSGTEIGSITVGSTSTTLYAPASSDSSSSSVDFTSIASNVVPSADITYNLGTGTKRWNYLYARYLRSYSSISPVYDTGATLGSASTRFSCIYSQSATFGDYMDVDNQVAYMVEFYNNDLYGYDDAQDEVWNISSYGYAQFMSVVDTSDQTKKNILGNTSLTLSQIANAPSVYFTWKNNKNTARQAGTLAQYWKSVLPEVVTGEEGNMGLMYGQTAVISAITIAKETETIKQRVDRLEAENKVLRDEIEELKNQLNSL